MHWSSYASCCGIAGAALLLATSVRAAVTPVGPDLPSRLSLDDALNIYHTHGLELLIADAAVHGAEGAVKIAGAIPNPVATASVSNAFTYSTSKQSTTNCLRNGAVCSPWSNNVGLSDSAALEDVISGKRGLRLEVANNALAAAKLSRVDAERTILFLVKSAYVQVAQATLSEEFAKFVAETQKTTLKKFHDRYNHGAINEGDLQRIEVQKLEADQAIAVAYQALRQARAGLAFLLGVRGTVPDFGVDVDVLSYKMPSALRNLDEVGLLRTAFERRPDLLSAGYTLQQAEAQVQLTQRQRFPDIALSMNYAWGGYGGYSTNGPIQGPAVLIGLSAPIPIFYSLDGELRQAYAQQEASALSQAKATAQVVNDVVSGLAAFNASRSLVERMEGPRREGGGLLESAKGAFEIVAIQYEKGAASLTDYLDALRGYITTKNEYFGDLAGYWIAVYQLEAAIAKDLR